MTRQLNSLAHLESAKKQMSVPVSECYYGGGEEEKQSTKTAKRTTSFAKARQTFTSAILKRRVAAISDFSGPDVTLRKRWKITLIILGLLGAATVIGLTCFIAVAKKANPNSTSDGLGNFDICDLHIIGV